MKWSAAEHSGTVWNSRNNNGGKQAMTRCSTFFSSPEQPERKAGNSPPPPPPLGGGGVDGERHSPLPAPAEGDREAMAAKVREAFPICSAFAAAFKAEFPETRMVFASEGGREIGKRGPDGVLVAYVGRMFPPQPERGRR